ncbi:hypothetical protein C8J56DRAFT_890385 [Mycena floridula]|nr:hypothetical protein C8J56DRAFT_890385 [Mycena floridula]
MAETKEKLAKRTAALQGNDELELVTETIRMAWSGLLYPISEWNQRIVKQPGLIAFSPGPCWEYSDGEQIGRNHKDQRGSDEDVDVTDILLHKLLDSTIHSVLDKEGERNEGIRIEPADALSPS